MPSIFSRARTSSTKTVTKAQPRSPDAGIDEFGRVTSRGAATPTPGARDKRAQTLPQSKRATHASAQDYEVEQELEDGFLPTSLISVQGESLGREYGYLGHETGIILSIEDVERLVKVVADELIQRGLTTPLLFSNMALDLDAPSVRRLIAAFLRSSDFREEARFANPHALGSFLRWGLARPVRIVGGYEFRGIIDWELYLHWRHIEHSGNFNKTEFSSFIAMLTNIHPQVQPHLRNLVLTLFSLLSRLLANSTSSGLTPPKLASLFGPLLFGLPTSSFHASYSAYLRSAHATEHLLLAYVRMQVAQAPPSAPPPRRLVSWVQGYPATLAPIDSFERPRLGAKIRRVASVRRNVRLYSEDLVRTCAAWAKAPEGAAVRASKEWGRIAPEKKDGSRLDPRYSDAYRKKLDLPSGFHPSTSNVPAPLASPSSTLSTPSLSTASSSASTRSSLFDDPVEEAKFRSLTDMKWGEFSMMGFGDVAPSALQFDLTESARSARSVKRQTLNWNDFSAAGFSRTDSSLSQTLQFSAPIQQTVKQWPEHEKEVHRKLKKNVQKALPPFGWDTAPVMDGREDVVEEGFLDAFCDLLYGGGWIDRSETTFRECNWALVEFKSLPTSRQDISPNAPSLSLSASADANDPRTSVALLLFEEFVPAEYRKSLLKQGNKPKTHTRFGITNLLSPRKGTGKQWKQAATLNGKPYTLGAVPSSPNPREKEAEFERLLTGGNLSATKIISLGSSAATVGHAAGATTSMALQVDPLAQEPKTSMSSSVYPASVTSPMTPGGADTSSAGHGPPLPSKTSAESPTAQRTASPFSPASLSLRKSRFRFPGASGKENRRGILIPSEYETVEFDTRLASYSDDELNARSSDDKAGPAGAPRKGTKEKRMSKDDAWVDILVASNGKRLANQDAEMRSRVGTSATGRTLGVGAASGAGRSDPELASMEVAQALASVRQPSLDSDSDDPRGRNPSPSPANGNGHSNGGDHQYASAEVEDGDDDDEAASRALRTAKRRLGYFDLHPERRPGRHDEPRHSEASGYQDSTYSEGDFEPTTSVISQEIEAPKSDIPFPGSLAGVTPSSAQSRTATLIEMYRERERQSGANVSSSQKPSRLPVRSPQGQDERSVSKPSHALSSKALTGHEPSHSPSPDLDDNHTVSGEGDSVVEEDDIDSVDIKALEPGAPYSFNELGRSSPGRYVHGAPLHNVLEEEEEP